MIKTVKLIKKIKGEFAIDLDLFEFNPNIKDDLNRESKYLTGAYYSNTNYPMIALFICNENGIITDDKIFLNEEGIPKYEELFKNLGYTLI